MTILSRLFTGGERRDLFANSSIIPSVEHMAEMVGQDSATRLIAVFRANQLLADTISTLPVGVFVRVGDQRVPVDGPGWLAQPDPTDPSITLVEHFSQVMWSLGLDGTSFTLALPNVDDPAELHVLDPKRVTIRKRGEWVVRLDDGTEKLGADQIVQIDRSRRPGQLRGMSPIDEASTTLGTQQAASRFGSKVFRNGVYMSGYLAIPGTKDPAILAQIKDEIEKQYGGANQMKPGAFTGGAEWKVPQISLEQLQFLELQKFGKVEIATLYGIPPHLLGVTEPGAMAYASVEAQGIEFEKFTIRPYIERIEAAYKRLIPGGDDTYLRFDTNGLLRGDFKTRMEGLGLAVDHKILTPTEGRRIEGYPDEPAGPYLETPNNNAPQAARQIA